MESDPKDEFIALVGGLLPYLERDVEVLDRSLVALAAVPRDDYQPQMMAVHGQIFHAGDKFMGLAMGAIRLGLAGDPRLAQFERLSERFHALDRRHSEISRAKGVWVPDMQPGKSLADLIDDPVPDPNVPLRTVAQWISTLINLYLLSDGRYWLDDVSMDEQFMLPPEIGEQLTLLLTPYDGFEAEDLDDVQRDYGLPAGHIPPDRLKIHPLGRQEIVIP